MAEFKYLEEINLDGKIYVNKAELRALIKSEKGKVLAGTEKGYIEKQKGRRIAAFLALNHLSMLINKREIDQYKHDNITHQKHIIMSVNMEEQECFLYFRGWCNHVPGSTGYVPIFTEDPTEAVEYDEEVTARKIADQIISEYPMMKLEVVRRGRVRIELGLRKLHEMYGWPDGRDEKDVIEDELFWTNTLGERK